MPSMMYLAGSCFFISKSKFEKVGLFDEDIFMYGEEEDIHYRLKKQFGPHFTYNSSIRYIHQTLDRPITLSTEQKIISSTTTLHDKKGFSKRTTYQNFKRYYRTRLFMARIKKALGDTTITERISILKELIRYCHTLK